MRAPAIGVGRAIVIRAAPSGEVVFPLGRSAAWDPRGPLLDRDLAAPFAKSPPLLYLVVVMGLSHE